MHVEAKETTLGDVLVRAFRRISSLAIHLKVRIIEGFCLNHFKEICSLWRRCSMSCLYEDFFQLAATGLPFENPRCCAIELLPLEAMKRVVEQNQKFQGPPQPQ
ncbi:uncharacterized protein LOC108198981 isoform X2 [Daucus carota subsp. sativus]|uniref:uncharacterized protein LOC108198981 isoform X2 n=1 Tax=Daucus carota subsp. sativus TaxID=79200 RepID=UPI003083D69A